MIDSKLNDILNSYDCNDSAYVISNYVKNNMKTIPTASIAEIAQACFVSKGQVSKFVRRLGYENYLDFKDACIDYLEAQDKKPQIFTVEYSFQKNVEIFANLYMKMLESIKKELNYQMLDRLISKIFYSRGIYLFAQGEARSICQIMQIELGNIGIPILINNSDFSRNFSYHKDYLILIISINGKSFEFNKSVIKKILNLSNETWVITCNPYVSFSKSKMIVPTENEHLNEFAIRFVTDILIARLKEMTVQKKAVSEMETF